MPPMTRQATQSAVVWRCQSPEQRAGDLRRDVQRGTANIFYGALPRHRTSCLEITRLDVSEPDVSRADFDLYYPACGVAGAALTSVARDQFRRATVAITLQRLNAARA